MNVIVFGSTGPTGQHLVRTALAAGHHVTAFARTPSKLQLTHERLRIHRGDVLDASTVQTAMAGQDAVVSALGAGVWSNDRVRERGTNHILLAMDEHRVDRLVALSSFGVGDSYAELPLFVRTIIVPFYLARAFRDCHAMEQRLMRSDRQWVVVRPPFLTDKPGVGSVQPLSPDTIKGLDLKVAREDVAAFMLDQIHSDEWVHKYAHISN